MNKPLLTATLLAFVALAGCAGGPKYPINKETNVPPREAIEKADALKGKTLVWGGVIAKADNLADATRLEIVAYPLEWDQHPNTDASALGRFIVETEGYLETADYAPERRVTVQGRLEKIRDGRVGEANYRYPVLSADKLHLWPVERIVGEPDGSFFSFGILISN